MKNLIWIFIGIVGLGVIVYVTLTENNTNIHLNVKLDSLNYKYNIGNNTSVSVQDMDYKPISNSPKPEENFLGKIFSTCMQMVYEWPDAQLYEANNDDLQKMIFMVNNTHHELTFINDSCVTDYVLKKEKK